MVTRFAAGDTWPVILHGREQPVSRSERDGGSDERSCERESGRGEHL